MTEYNSLIAEVKAGIPSESERMRSLGVLLTIAFALLFWIVVIGTAIVLGG